ncbi:MAG: glycosyltransferase family 9 protein, partial [Nitrospinales bacterium]
MRFDKHSLPAHAKILLIRLRSIGDVVLNTAVFPLIKENFPDGQLDYLVTPPHHELIQNNPHLDEIILLNAPGEKNRGGYFPWEYLQTLRRLRKKHYDLIIDMHAGPRSAMITALSGAKFKVGLKRSRRAFFYNVKVDPVFEEPVTAVAFQTKMLEQLGFDVRYQAPTLYITRDESNAMTERLNSAGISQDAVFGVIHPGVASLHNEWQAEKFAEVADTLQTRDNIRVVFASAPNQMDQVEDIQKKIRTA